eukprot:6284875-Pyramimonas_sp.AAC.1
MLEAICAIIHDGGLPKESTFRYESWQSWCYEALEGSGSQAFAYLKGGERGEASVYPVDQGFSSSLTVEMEHEWRKWNGEWEGKEEHGGEGS